MKLPDATLAKITKEAITLQRKLNRLENRWNSRVRRMSERAWLRHCEATGAYVNFNDWRDDL